LKISNETKVGALTAIAITFLILGYNYMANEGDIFKPKSYYYALYEQAPGLNKGQKVLLNGYKVGFVQDVSYDQETNRVIVVIKITEKLNIPKNSVAQIISEDLLGARAIKLIFDENTNDYLKDGDTLLASLEISRLDEFSRSVDPMVHKVEALVEYLDSVIIRSGQLQATLTKTSDVMTSIELLANKSSSMISQNNTNIYETINNLKLITAEFAKNRESFSTTMNNIGEFSKELNESQIIQLLSTTLTSLESIAKKIDEGEGTAGKLVNDEELYKQLNATLAEVNRLLIDINKYPEKYVPMPWGKKQRKKAKEQSAKDTHNQ